jgi:ActR/RegA family two-component response regulator
MSSSVRHDKGRSLGRVLVVDDDEGAGSALAIYLAKEVPCEADSTVDTNAPLMAAGKKEHDLYVVDLRMAGRDGLTVLAELKSRFPDCEVIIVTDYAGIDSAKYAMKLGAIDYCDRGTKGLAEIAASVRDALTRRPSQREPGFHRESLIDFFHRRLGAAKAAGEGAIHPGVALEYLVKLLLDSCGIFNTHGMRVRSKTEEIDVVFRIHSADHHFWSKQGTLILVECKDFSKSKPGANERSRFETKVNKRQPNCMVGLFVSSGGFAKTFMQSVTTGTRPPVIVPIDGADLRQWMSAADRLEWLTKHAIDEVMRR